MPKATSISTTNRPTEQSEIFNAIHAQRELLEAMIEALSQKMDAETRLGEHSHAAQDQALNKAEAFNEKRYDQQQQQIRELGQLVAEGMSRDEANVRITGISEKLNTESRRTTERLNEMELRLTSRLDVMAGTKQGGTETRTNQYLLLAAIVAVLTIFSILAATGVFSVK